MEGNGEQEVQQIRPRPQQPPNHHDAHQAQNSRVGAAPRGGNRHPGDLRNIINASRDARTIISAQRRECEYDHEDSNRFLAFTKDITSRRFPKDFKPTSILKYDGKQDPQQWLRCYFVAIEVAGGTNSTKALYFPMALEAAPLTWLENLKPNSISS